jgi:hypothetical protein
MLPTARVLQLIRTSHSPSFSLTTFIKQTVEFEKMVIGVVAPFYGDPRISRFTHCFFGFRTKRPRPRARFKSTLAVAGAWSVSQRRLGTARHGGRRL